MKTIFVTGATGFLGGYFVCHLLQNTTENIYCLAREKGISSAEERIKQNLRNIENSFSKINVNDKQFEEKMNRRIKVINGDITEKNLGISNCQQITCIDEFWHIAGNVQFLESKMQEVMATNVEGGKNVLQFIKNNNIPILNYISTAYVAGQKNGNIMEILADETFPANNVYEQSKRIMEKEIIAAHNRGECNYRIFRPAIIVGHSQTFEPDPSLGGIYGFLSLGLSLKRQIETKEPDYFKHNTVSIISTANVTLSLISVDHVVDVLVQISNNPESVNKIFHVAPAEETDLVKFVSLSQKLLGLNIEFVFHRVDLKLVDKLFNKKTERYNCYLFYKKHFETSEARTYCRLKYEQYKLSDHILNKMIEKFCANHNEKIKNKRAMKQQKKKKLHDLKYHFQLFPSLQNLPIAM